MHEYDHEDRHDNDDEQSSSYENIESDQNCG